ncbi:M91 family zinc metallopeptidase [Coleofasciculus sp. G2-EDA-02]|uniref:M91 family zinc metallopeptidase n=1 Tax=Coleofasciculus sp. G2-EDA-02 TaxID=3069529 RepID=UPI00330252EA
MASLPGRGESTDFGVYWVLPDSVDRAGMSYLEGAEAISETDFDVLQQAWESLRAGSGQIQVLEEDSVGNRHDGFRERILAQLGRLLSRPAGRRLVLDLMYGAIRVRIIPAADSAIGARTLPDSEDAFEQPTGAPGRGSSSTIEVAADLQDDDVQVLDQEGNLMDSPVFISLGHELIHASHNAAGRNRRRTPFPPIEPSLHPYEAAPRGPRMIASPGERERQEYDDNLEERQTVEIENLLREEHGLPRRLGHLGFYLGSAEGREEAARYTEMQRPEVERRAREVERRARLEADLERLRELE